MSQICTDTEKGTQLKQIRLCVFGHSGSGKSTAASHIIQRFQDGGYSTTVIKLAEPLYRLQREIYATAGRQIRQYEQDQQMLEGLARELRRINPRALVEDFERRLAVSASTVVVCDDLRDGNVDYPYLKEQGFLFLRIQVKPEVAQYRLQQRQDLSTVLNSPASKDVDTMHCDFEVHNDASDLDTLLHQLDAIVSKLIV